MGKRSWNINLEGMIGAKVHLVHDANPKMAPYIYAKRKDEVNIKKGNKGEGNYNYVINLAITARCLSEACDLVFDAASRRKNFLIVGTGKGVNDLVASEAKKALCHYVNKKRLVGLLTNWSTTKMKLQKLRDLRAKQKMGEFNRLSKRDTAMLNRKLSILEKYLGGIKYMTRLPDIVIIVNHKKDYKVLKECAILGIPTISLIDTNCNPDLADISIPTNDSLLSIRWILKKLAHAIWEGRSGYITRRRSEDKKFRDDCPIRRLRR